MTTALRVDAETQLALLTTSDGQGPHTRSVYLVATEAATTELHCVDNLSFSLVVSVHEDLNPYLLREAMHDEYYRHHYSKEAVARIWRETMPPGALALPPEQRPANQHPLFRIAHRRRELYEIYQRHLADEQWQHARGDRLATVAAAMKQPGFFFIKHQTILSPNERCKLTLKLRKLHQQQWRFTFDNHQTLLYFVDQFSRPFRVQGTKTEVLVLHATPEHSLERLGTDRDAAWHYVARQTPLFAHSHDCLQWGFAERRPIGECYVHRARPRDASPAELSWEAWATERLRQPHHVALNVFDFTLVTLPGRQFYLVDYKCRLASLAVPRAAEPPPEETVPPVATKSPPKKPTPVKEIVVRTDTARPKLKRSGVQHFSQQKLSFASTIVSGDDDAAATPHKKRKVQ